jgi:hypothetical protein
MEVPPNFITRRDKNILLRAGFAAGGFYPTLVGAATRNIFSNRPFLLPRPRRRPKQAS